MFDAFVPVFCVLAVEILYGSVSQPPGGGPVPGPGIKYTGRQEFVILVFEAFFMNKYFIVEIFRGE
jgi:hypothetical protein